MAEHLLNASMIHVPSYDSQSSVIVGIGSNNPGG